MKHVCLTRNRSSLPSSTEVEQNRVKIFRYRGEKASRACTFVWKTINTTSVRAV